MIRTPANQQLNKFRQVARELGTDESEEAEAFDRVLKRVATARLAASEKPQERHGMSRRKGEWTPRRTDQEYPEQVEIVVEYPGLGQRLNAMHAWCAPFDYRTRSVNRYPVHAMRWCFRDSSAADDFAATFGGERVRAEGRR